MASQEIAINTSTLDGDIDKLSTVLEKIKSQLEMTFAEVQALDGMWDGPANETFVTQFTKDYNDSLELCKVIQSLIDCMDYAKKQYDSCENEVNNIVSSISI